MIDIMITGNEKYKYALIHNNTVLCLLDDKGLENLSKVINKIHNEKVTSISYESEE